jgi:hypothetical protein
MKTKKKLSQHSIITVNTFFKRRRRLHVSALLTFVAIVAAAFYYTAEPPTVEAASNTILISEVEFDPALAGLDNNNEWFELVNITGSPQTLTGWSIVDNTSSDTIPTVTIPAGGYIVVAANSATFLADHPGFSGTVVNLGSAIGNGLANNDVLTLRDNTPAAIDCVSWGTDVSCLNPAVTSLPTADTSQTIQRKSTVDHDTNEDWVVAAETPGAALSFQGVLVDSSSRGCQFFDLLTPPVATWTHTVGSGANRLLVIGISTYTVTAVAASRVLSVTYGGQTLTRIDDTLTRTANNTTQVEMFYLTETGIAAATNSTVQVTFNPVGTTTTAYYVGGAVSFFNVNQTTPFNTGQSTAGFPTYARATGSSTTPTVTVATKNNEVVLDTVAGPFTGAGTAGLTPNALQNEKWNGKNGCFLAADSVGAGSTKQVPTTPTVTSTTMSWTLGTSQQWAIGAVSILPQAVTEVKLSSLTATESNGGTVLRWQTGDELNNLGFNVYREQRGKRTRLNQSIVAGSALLAGQGTRLTAGQSYSWQDRSSKNKEAVQYWLEDIDLNGTRTLHGPIVPTAGESARASKDEQAILLSQLNELQPSTNFSVTGHPATQKQAIEQTVPALAQQAQAPSAQLAQTRRLASKLLLLNEALLDAVVPEIAPSERRLTIALEDPSTRQRALASGAAVKIAVRQPGWYRVTQPELIAAGLNPNVDPSLLQLYADGEEQAILQNGSKKQFGADGSIEFYGTGMDTPTSDTRTYWLIVGAQPGKRINGQGNQNNSSSGSVANEVLTINPTTEIAPKPRPTTNPVTPDKPVVISPAPAVTKPNVPGVWLILPSNPSSSISSDAPKEKKKASKKKAVRKYSRRAHSSFGRRKDSQNIQAETSSLGFAYVVERKDRMNYFSGLLNGEAENFFGPLILSSSPAKQDLSVNDVDNTVSAPATLEVALQGLTGQAHQVKVSFNGVEVGVLDFADQGRAVKQFSIARTSLVEGNNTVTFISTGGEADISLIDYVRLTYVRAYRAKDDTLTFTSQHTALMTVSGFTTQQIRVFDITDQSAVERLGIKVSQKGSEYVVKIPGGNGNSRTLLALAEGQEQHPAGITANEPSNLSRSDNRADFIILTHRDFRDAVKPLADLRRSQGLEVAIVDVENVYDEFSYGAHGGQAVKDFLAWAKTNWALAPRYVLLVGDATLDPRNYLGFGNQDFVPTKLVDATVLETASDDALCDFDGDGLADMAIGRLPVKTIEQAQKVIGKIMNYAPGQPAYGALLVSDRKEGYDFEAASQQVRSLLPPDLSVTTVNRRDNPTEQVRSEIMSGINAGPLLVNFAGHGSSDVWTGAGILNSSDAGALSNGNRLPLFVSMTCLNGRFQDPFRETLAEALMRADNGGAVAVWASSGLTEPGAQAAIDQQLMRLLFSSGQPPTLGDAIRGAKAATTNVDVRRTWVFFGDPTMRIR